MPENYIIYGALVAIVVVLVMYPVSAFGVRREHMVPIVPLDAGTFPNEYSQGKCEQASTQRCDCTVGNCPVGSFITNNEYCSIHCAQISNKKLQEECNASCMNIVTDCNEPDLSKCDDSRKVQH